MGLMAWIGLADGGQAVPAGGPGRYGPDRCGGRGRVGWPPLQHGGGRRAWPEPRPRGDRCCADPAQPDAGMTQSNAPMPAHL
jgi:hypothetical protein